mgnify:CR=1 FL=1
MKSTQSVSFFHYYVFDDKIQTYQYFWVYFIDEKYLINSKRFWTHCETANTNSQALHSRGLAKSLLLLLIYLRV